MISWIIITWMTNIALKTMVDGKTGAAWIDMSPLISNSLLLLQTTITIITTATMTGFKLLVLKFISDAQRILGMWNQPHLGMIKQPRRKQLRHQKQLSISTMSTDWIRNI